MVGARSGRMIQTRPDLQPIPYKRFVPKEGQVLLHPDTHAEAREAFANYFCKFDFTGQVPKEKEKNEQN